jgi:hypothetical protein
MSVFPPVHLQTRTADKFEGLVDTLGAQLWEVGHDEEEVKRVAPSPSDIVEEVKLRTEDSALAAQLCMFAVGHVDELAAKILDKCKSCCHMVKMTLGNISLHECM